MCLEKIQNAMSDFLYSKAPSEEEQAWIANYLVIDSPLEIESRLKVYRNNLLITLMETLQESFPVTAKILGYEKFRLQAREYIFSEPSCGNDLDSYGKTFPEFIGRKIDCYWLSDLLRFEWYWAQTDLRTSSLLSLNFDVLSIWRNEKREKASPGVFYYFFWIKDEQRMVHAVEPELWPLLRELYKGKTIAEISQQKFFKQNPHRLVEGLQVIVYREWHLPIVPS